jgi:hypothetical protein
MTLFNKIFSTRTLLQIICILGTVVVMKLLSSLRQRKRSYGIAGSEVSR